MTKALDYVSDYQLKTACKDAMCIAPLKVTQMILAVLKGLISSRRPYTQLYTGKFLHIYLLFYCQKSGNEPDAYKKRYSRIRIFTFYLLRQSSIPPVGYRTLDVSTAAAAPTMLLLVIPGNQGWLW